MQGSVCIRSNSRVDLRKTERMILPKTIPWSVYLCRNVVRPRLNLKILEPNRLNQEDFHSNTFASRIKSANGSALSGRENIISLPRKVHISH